MTPVVTLALVDEARRELEYVLANGAKAILIKPAPVKGLHGWRSPALPEFDPFWRDVQDAGIAGLPAREPAAAGRIRQLGTAEDQQLHGDERVPLGRARPPRDLGHDRRLICHGTLTRFPKLRIASIENGAPGSTG